jgi:2-polyprenyl-6-methoxyphenol hydroxylase-like FAD-dependent oxidoreductase
MASGGAAGAASAHAAAAGAPTAALAGALSATMGHGGAPRCERIFTAPPLARWHEGRAVLLGDAAHAMPINLAQGAAAGIEGAYLLGAALSAIGSAPSLGELDAAFGTYHAAHAPRVRQCRVLTAFTEALAWPASPPTEAVRNAMALVPQPLNSAIFDTALGLSLGDLPASTRERWPLSIHTR